MASTYEGVSSAQATKFVPLWKWDKFEGQIIAEFVPRQKELKKVGQILEHKICPTFF